MKIRGVSRLKRAYRTLRFLQKPRGVVLLYHRVADIRRDPQLLSVSQKNFEGHIKLLLSKYKPVSTSEMVRSLKDGRIERGSVTVTFDDGYLDNLEFATPILERLGVPATIFATTCQLDHGVVYWWDELERLLLRGRTDGPSNIVIEQTGNIEKFDVDTSEEGPGTESWNVLSDSDPTRAHATYRRLCRILRESTLGRRELILEQLREQLAPTNEPSALARSMNSSELKFLGSKPLISIGAHTVNHLSLAAQPGTTQRKELVDCRDDLEELLGTRISVLAFPYGEKRDYSAETKDLARAAGYHCAFANYAGAVTENTDLFEIPRFVVRNWSPEDLDKQLQKWFRTP